MSLLVNLIIVAGDVPIFHVFHSKLEIIRSIVVFGSMFPLLVIGQRTIIGMTVLFVTHSGIQMLRIAFWDCDETCVATLCATLLIYFAFTLFVRSQVIKAIVYY